MNNFTLVIDDTDDCLYFINSKKDRISPKFMNDKDAITWLMSNYDESYYEVSHKVN